MNIHQRRKDEVRRSMVRIRRAIKKQQEIIALLDLALSGINKVNGRPTEERGIKE